MCPRILESADGYPGTYDKDQPPALRLMDIGDSVWSTGIGSRQCRRLKISGVSRETSTGTNSRQPHKMELSVKADVFTDVTPTNSRANFKSMVNGHLK